MAQAGLHALVGTVTRKLTSQRDWLMLGVILGSLIPDLDNYAVAAATVAGLDTHGLHRTFTHSLLTLLVITVVFMLVGLIVKQVRWANLGIGLGVGMVLHILVDLLIWFNGVELLWPLSSWVNIWQGLQPAQWFTKLLDPAEFLFFALFFLWLARAAQSCRTDLDFRPALRWWAIGMLALLVVFTPLAYLISKGFQTIYGVFYLISLTAAFVISIRMRKTIEAFGR